MAFLAGILIAVLTVGLAYAMLRPRSRGFYGLFLIFTSLIHLVLRIEEGAFVPISLEVIVSGLFIALSITLVRVNSPPLSWSMLAGGLFFHAGLDLFRVVYLAGPFASSWYAALCSTLNGALGVWILSIILMEDRTDSRNDVP